MDGYGLQYLLLLAALALWGGTRGRRLWRDWQAFQVWRATHVVPGEARPGPAPEPAPMLDPTVVPGAARAMAHPPQDLRDTLRQLEIAGAQPYSLPLGWRVTSTGLVSIVWVSLVEDATHILLTGFTGSGKDSWAAGALLALAHSLAPERLQIAVLDGKGGLSWIGWGTKRHVRLLAEEPDAIRPAMDDLKAERERRQRILKAADCEKWEEYRGPDMPLLVVYVAELLLLQDATSRTDLADWLNTELTSARAAGIRYIVSTQTVTRMDTRWRSQISLYVAGYQPRADADEPNTSFPTRDLLRFGLHPNGTTLGLPPSALPVPPDGAGVFTCVQGRTVLTLRASYYPREQRRWALQQLPDRPPAPAPVVAAPAPVVAVPAPPPPDHPDYLLYLLHNGHPIPFEDDPPAAAAPVLVLPAEVVPAAEQQRILAAAPTAPSRSKLCLALYGSRGGSRYSWVQQVCDAAGLLLPDVAPSSPSVPSA